MLTPTLVVRTMRRGDVAAVADLLTAHASIARIAGHRRRSLDDAFTQRMLAGNVDIAVRTTGNRVATATSSTLVGVAVVTAHPFDDSGAETVHFPRHAVQCEEQRSNQQLDPESTEAGYCVLHDLVIRGKAVRDDAIAALLHVVHTRLDSEGMGCYVRAEQRNLPDLERHSYIDISDATQHGKGSLVRHLWRHPDPAGATSRSARTKMPARNQRPRDTWTAPAVQQEACRLHNDGWAITKIAAYLGCGHSTVSQLLRRSREHRTYPSVTPDMVQRYQQGHDSVGSIAARIRCDYDTARSLLRNAGATIPDLDEGTLLAEIIDRYKEGQSISRIAADLDRSYNYIRNQLRDTPDVELRQHGGARQRRRVLPTSHTEGEH